MAGPAGIWYGVWLGLKRAPQSEFLGAGLIETGHLQLFLIDLELCGMTGLRDEGVPGDRFPLS
jgi:hypothetical protein